MTAAQLDAWHVDADSDGLFLPGASLPVNREAAEEVWAGALCAQTDPELFFPEPRGSAEPALRICRRCPVREVCLAVFGPLLPYGVAGGLTSGERAERHLLAVRTIGAA